MVELDSGRDARSSFFRLLVVGDVGFSSRQQTKCAATRKRSRSAVQTR
jgi:hypothetical protein